MSGECKFMACRNKAVLKRLPADDLAQLATSAALPERCRQAVFHFGASTRRLAAAQILSVLAHPLLPRKCQHDVFGNDELVGQISADQLVALLQNNDLPAEVKEQAVKRPAVLAKIPPARVTDLLVDDRLPAACGAALFGDPKLVDGVATEKILPLLTNPKLPKSCRELAFGCRELLARIPADDAFKLLCALALPPSLKQKALANTELLKKVLQGDSVAVLAATDVPIDCCRTIANFMDLTAIPQQRLVQALELDIIPESRRQELVRCRMEDFSGQDVCHLLASERIPLVVKMAASPAKLESRHALELLKCRHTPRAFSTYLIERLPQVFAPADLEGIFVAGRVLDVQQQRQIVEAYLAANPQGVVALLGSKAIPEPFKQLALQEPAFEQTPESEFPALLALPGVELDVKAACLAKFVLANKRLPQGCETIFTEEMAAPETWPVGCAAALFRRLDGKTLFNLRANRPASCSTIDSELSLFVSLFKANIASQDYEKTGVLAALTRGLLDLHASAIRGGHPEGKPQLHRIVDALRELLASQPANELGRPLCQITSRMLEDLGDFGNTDQYLRIPATLELFRTRCSYTEFWLSNGPEWRLHRIWELVLFDLQGLSKERLGAAAAVALTQPSAPGNPWPVDHYSRLMENLALLFLPAKSPEQRLSCIARLVASYGLDVNTIMPADSPTLPSVLVLPPLPESPPTKKHKKGKGWFTWFLIVLALLAVTELPGL